MAIQAVIFDLDGTLCDYHISVEKALKKAVIVHSPQLWAKRKEIFTKQNYNRFFKEAAARRHHREEFEINTRQEAFRELLLDANIKNNNLAGKIAGTYTDQRVNSLKLFEEVKKVLKKVSSKFKVGLLTNGPSDIQWEKIKKLNLANQFDQIIVSGDFGLAKPSQPIFKEMINRLNCKPQEAVYVGDSLEYDVLGANDSGLVSVWINRTKQKPPSDQPKPDYEIDNLRGLLNFVGLNSE